MYRLLLPLIACLILVGCQSSTHPVHVASASAASAPPLVLIGSIPLEGVHGRLDHMTTDPTGRWLYVAALENHSVEVVDLQAKRRVHTIAGINEPQGLTYVVWSNQGTWTSRLLVCSRGDGTCRSFDPATFQEGAWVDLGRNADNIRRSYAGASDMVYAGSGGEPGNGLISAIDVAGLLPPGLGGKPADPRSPADLRLDQPRQATVKAEVELPSHPESFQLTDDGKRIYVNLPDEHQVVVIDVTKEGLKIAEKWPVTAGERNFAMTLDASASRLFITCRQPACAVAYDCHTGKQLWSVPCVGDADDMFYDDLSHRLYIIGGEGFADVFDAAPGAGTPTRLTHVATAAKARTGLFLPNLHKLAANPPLLVVAAPKVGAEPARILLYRALP